MMRLSFLWAGVVYEALRKSYITEETLTRFLTVKCHQHITGESNLSFKMERFLKEEMMK